MGKKREVEGLNKLSRRVEGVHRGRGCCVRGQLEVRCVSVKPHRVLDDVLRRSRLGHPRSTSTDVPPSWSGGVPSSLTRNISSSLVLLWGRRKPRRPPPLRFNWGDWTRRRAGDGVSRPSAENGSGVGCIDPPRNPDAVLGVGPKSDEPLEEGEPCSRARGVELGSLELIERHSRRRGSRRRGGAARAGVGSDEGEDVMEEDDRPG